MNTGEFNHYPGCNNDPDNCSACALTKPTMIDHGNGVEKKSINYAAWPLSYMSNGRQIPKKFMKYLREELDTDNKPYLVNLITQLNTNGYNTQKIARMQS